MEVKVEEIAYYDPLEVMSKQRSVNMVIGGRGIGKTYGFKRELMRRAIADPKKSKFIYMRRLGTEVKATKNWFGTIPTDPMFEGYVFTKKGRYLYFAKEPENEDDSPDWIEMGWIVALNQFKEQKSQEYDEYKYLLYDEWLGEGATDFLNDEVKTFLNLINSIFRNRAIRVYCLANATMLHNPYFDYWEFYPNLSKEYTFLKQRNMLIQLVDSKEFVKQTAKSDIMLLTKGTPYYDYAFGNEFKDDDDSLIEPRDNKTTNEAILKLDERTYIGIWENDDSQFWFSEKYNKSTPLKAALDPIHVNEEYLAASVFYKSLLFEKLQMAKEYGDIRFDSKKTKGKANNVVKMLGLFR